MQEGVQDQKNAQRGQGITVLKVRLILQENR